MRTLILAVLIGLSFTAPVFAVDVDVTGGIPMQIACTVHDAASLSPSWSASCYQNGNVTCPAGTEYRWNGAFADEDGNPEIYRVNFTDSASFTPSLYVNGTFINCPGASYNRALPPQVGGSISGSRTQLRNNPPAVNQQTQNTAQGTAASNLSSTGNTGATPTPGGIVNCNTQWNGRQFTDPCNFEAAMQLLQRAIDWMFYLAVPISVIGFLYAGYLYLFAFNKPENIKTAHGLFKTVLIGFGIMLTAWILVTTIVKAVVDLEGTDTPVSQSDFRRFIQDF